MSKKYVLPEEKIEIEKKMVTFMLSQLEEFQSENT